MHDKGGHFGSVQLRHNGHRMTHEADPDTGSTPFDRTHVKKVEEIRNASGLPDVLITWPHCCDS